MNSENTQICTHKSGAKTEIKFSILKAPSRVDEVSYKCLLSCGWKITRLFTSEVKRHQLHTPDLTTHKIKMSSESAVVETKEEQVRISPPHSGKYISRIKPCMRKFISLRLFHQDFDIIYRKILIVSIKCYFTK